MERKNSASSISLPFYIQPFQQTYQLCLQEAPGTQPPLAACTATVPFWARGISFSPGGWEQPPTISLLHPEPKSTLNTAPRGPLTGKSGCLMPHSTQKPHSSVARSQTPLMLTPDPSPTLLSCAPVSLSLLAVPQTPKAAPLIWPSLPFTSA